MGEKSKALPFAPAPKGLDGTMAGDVGFDPLGLAEYGDIKWMREAELKHGRICMLAFIGYSAVDLGLRFPGEKYASLTSFTAHDTLLNSGEMFLLFLFVAAFETTSFAPIYEMCMGSGREPGDFGFDPAELNTPDKIDRYKLVEITHCRAAMIGFSGIVTQSAVLGHSIYPYTS